MSTTNPADSQAVKAAKKERPVVPKITVREWRAALTHRDRVLAAGLLAASPELRHAELTRGDWTARLTTYANSPRV